MYKRGGNNSTSVLVTTNYLRLAVPQRVVLNNFLEDFDSFLRFYNDSDVAPPSLPTTFATVATTVAATASLTLVKGGVPNHSKLIEFMEIVKSVKGCLATCDDDQVMSLISAVVYETLVAAYHVNSDMQSKAKTNLTLLVKFMLEGGCAIPRYKVQGTYREFIHTPSDLSQLLIARYRELGKY